MLKSLPEISRFCLAEAQEVLHLSGDPPNVCSPLIFDHHFPNMAIKLGKTSPNISFILGYVGHVW